MDFKTKIVRSLERATSDKRELHDVVLKYKKRFDEAGSVLKTDSNRKKE